MRVPHSDALSPCRALRLCRESPRTSSAALRAPLRGDPPSARRELRTSAPLCHSFRVIGGIRSVLSPLAVGYFRADAYTEPGASEKERENLCKAQAFWKTRRENVAEQEASAFFRRIRWARILAHENDRNDPERSQQVQRSAVIRQNTCERRRKSRSLRVKIRPQTSTGASIGDKSAKLQKCRHCKK